MSKMYKTARGKMIDMGKIKLAQENTNAVGNMRVNAKGDLLGNGNEVAIGRNAVMDKVYAVPDGPVGGLSTVDRSNRVRQQPAPTPQEVPQASPVAITPTETHPSKLAEADSIEQEVPAVVQETEDESPTRIVSKVKKSS